MPFALPAWVVRFLPHLAIAALLLFAIYRIDQAGYRRAAQDAELRERRQAEQVAAEVRAMEGRLAADMRARDARLTASLTAIAEHQRRAAAAIEQEIARDPLASNPAARVSDGSLRALNDARAGPGPATPAGAPRQPARAVPRP